MSVLVEECLHYKSSRCLFPIVLSWEDGVSLLWAPACLFVGCVFIVPCVVLGAACDCTVTT